MKKIFLSIISLSLLTLTSCGPAANNTVIPENQNPDNGEVAEGIINNVEEEEANDTNKYINEKKDGTLYFYLPNSNADGFDVVEEKVADLSNLKAIVEREIELSSAVPKNTVINSVTVDNKTAYVDVNSVYSEDPNTNSSAASMLKVYSIVNVLYHNKVLGIDNVKFLIDGEETETISIMSNTGFVGSGVINQEPSDETYNDPRKFTPDNEKAAINEKTDGTIYFFISNDNADGFDIVEKNVGTTDLKEVLDLAVSELSIPTIPEGTIINSAYVKDGIAYIDLNDFFASDSQSSSSTASYLKVYSIVNLAIYNKVFQANKVVLSIDGSTDGYIAQGSISEFYTEKLFNKGTY